MGRNRAKPSEIRKLEGNPGHRPIKDNPKPEQLDMKPPTYLGKYAKQAWERLKKAMSIAPILTKVDWAAFEQYCWLYQRYRDKIAADENPLNEIKEMRYLAGEMGFTPASRSKLDVKDMPDPADEMEGYFKSKIG